MFIKKNNTQVAGISKIKIFSHAFHSRKTAIHPKNRNYVHNSEGSKLFLYKNIFKYTLVTYLEFQNNKKIKLSLILSNYDYYMKISNIESKY